MMTIAYVHPEISPAPLFFLSEEQNGELLATPSLLAPVDGSMDASTLEKLHATIVAVLNDMIVVRKYGSIAQAEKKVIRFSKLGGTPVRREVMEEMEAS